jgi:Putative Flp pilus-assembly TadE/G-like
MRAGKTQVLRTKESGMILYLVAAGMVLLIGVLGLAVDLVSYYTVRSEAQRAADAAALAGASVFVTSGCTGGVSGVACTSAAVHTAVENQAAAVGNANKVGGQSPGIVAATDVTFSTDTASSYNPRVTVLVQRTTANSNAMPTFFLKIFGVQSINVSAKATAEAYNPTGGTSTSPSICLSCVKPFIGVDCDTNHIVASGNANANHNCPDTGGFDSYIFNPTTKAIVHPGVAPSGIIGSSITLHGEAGPADYETVDLGQGNGASATADAITSCYPGNWGCGDTIQLVPGKKVGQVTSGTLTLIHEGTQCTPSGQDTIAFSSATTPPYTITGGSANPYGLSGKKITTSDSIVTVPVYDGTSTGNGSNKTFTIIGFMQIFITDACHSGSSDTITANVMNVLTCQTLSAGCNGTGTSGNPGGGFVSGGGATAIPVRLVQ